MKNSIYEIRTDLACERYRADEDCSGVYYSQDKVGNIEIGELKITNEEGAKNQGIAVGHYTTLFFENLSEMQEDEQERLSEVLSEKLEKYVLDITKKESVKDTSVLVVGLGNRYITADAVGTLAARFITATGHIAENAPKIFEQYFGSRITIISPGVMSQTGLESSYIIGSIAKKLSPDLIIAIDALVARSCERLATTIQICNTGITPGSGIGNQRESLNKENLGVPTIAIGVPTVVESSTLVYDALERAGITDISNELQKVLKSGNSFFVTPKDSDLVTENAARIISMSINSVFNAGLYR